MDLELRRLDRLAIGGDLEAKNRAARMRCRIGDHDWVCKDWSFAEKCSVCECNRPCILQLPRINFDYGAAEFKILEYADSDIWSTFNFYNGFANTITTTTEPFEEEGEDPRKGSPPPYTWHPTKKRPWQKPGYRKRIKARRKRSRR